MAVKSIIEVDVQDGAFQKFREQFNAYSAALEKTPAAWKNVTAEAGKAGKTFDSVANSAAGIGEGATAARKAFGELNYESGRLADHQSRIGVLAKDQSKSWHQMAVSTKGFASNIAGATTTFLKWGSIFAAGSIFGMDRLAAAGADRRRSAMGLGVTPGQESSFETNLQRLVDTKSLLGGVNEGLHDPTKSRGFYGLGLDYNAEQQKGTFEASKDVIKAFKGFVDKTPDALLGNAIKNYGFDQFGFTLEDAMRMKRTPLSEVQADLRNVDANRKAQDLSAAQSKAWQDLSVNLQNAGKSIETSLMKSLAPLAPAVGHIASAFADAAKAVADNAAFKTWATEMGQAVDQFVIDCGTMGRAVKGIFDWLPNWVKTPGDNKSIGPGGAPGTSGGRSEVGPGGGSPDRSPFLNWLLGPASYKSAPPSGFMGGTVPASFRPGSGFSSGISPLLLASVEWQESRGRDVTNPNSGASGYYQFMPATAKQYGVDVHSEASSLNGARNYLTDLQKQFGSVEKALAAWNWGPGNLKRDLAQYGDDWRAHLPQETARFVKDVLGRVGGQYGNKFPDRSLRVQINNNTGGNTTVSAQQLTGSV